MAEERDPLTEAEKNRLTPDGMRPAEAGYVSSEGTPTAASGTYTPGSRDPAEIQRDIARTRAEMSETVDAIGARFDPDYLKEQAKDVVRSTARDARSTMIDTIKENPVPSILAGLSLGWLIAKGATTDHDRDRRDYEEHYFRIYGRYPDYRSAYVGLRGQGYPAASGYPSGYTADSGSPSAADQARQKAQQAADQAGDLAHEASHKAEHLADRATGLASEAGHQIEHYGHQATTWLQDQVYRNPLGVGAAALAAGALVGMAVPETNAENRLIGEQAERAKAQARSAAQEKLDQAKDVAAKVADEAADRAESVAQTAKSEAKDVAETAKSEAKKEGLDEPPKAVSGSSGSSSGASPSGSTSGGSSSGGSSSGSASSGGSMSGGSTSGNSMSSGSMPGTPGSSSAGSTSGAAGSGTTAGTPTSGSGSTSR